jgi:hypothetical protein
MHARVEVMVAGSRWSVMFVAGFAIENAPRTLSNARTHRLSDFIYNIDIRCVRD